MKEQHFKVESEKVGLKAQHSENEDHGIWSHHFMANRWGNSVRLWSCMDVRVGLLRKLSAKELMLLN